MVYVTFRPGDGKWLVWCSACNMEKVVADENQASQERRKHRCG